MRSHASQKYFWCLSLCVTIFVFTFLAARNNRATPALVDKDDNKFPGVRLTAVSQRRRPERGPNEGNPEGGDYQEVIRDDLLIRFRLANNGELRVYYLARLNTIEPALYQLFRNTGEESWRTTSPARGRQGSFTGGGYQWLMLPQGTAVEFETLDLSTRGQEHSISIFVSFQPRHEDRTEFLSDVYRTMNR